MVNPINWRELDLTIYGYLYIYLGIGFEVVDGGLARPDVSIDRDLYIGMAGTRVPTRGRGLENLFYSFFHLYATACPLLNLKSLLYFLRNFS